MKISKFGRQFHPAIVQHNVGKFELSYSIWELNIIEISYSFGENFLGFLALIE